MLLIAIKFYYDPNQGIEELLFHYFSSYFLITI